MIKPKTRKEKLLSAIANDTKVPIQPKNREELFLAQIAEKTSNVPKPIPYDYMPEGYPKKSGVDVITWDGKTEGLVSATDEDGNTYYKMSDAVLTLDELVGVTIKIRKQDGSVYERELVSKGFTTPPDGLMSEFVAVANVDNAVLNQGLVLPEAGTYFMRNEEEYIIELPVSTVKVEPIAYEFMPKGYPKIDLKPVTIFDQTVEGFAENSGMYMVELTDATFELVAGDKYTVTWDGVEYTDLIAAALQGNVFIGADPTGEITEEIPFIIAFSSEYGICVYTISTESSHTISITHISEVVTPMDDRFVGNTAFVVNATLNSYFYPKSFDKSYEETVAAFDAGKLVLCNVADSDGNVIYRNLVAHGYQTKAVWFSGYDGRRGEMIVVGGGKASRNV